MIQKYLVLCCVILLGSCAVKKPKPHPIVLKPLTISTKNKLVRERPSKEIDILHTELNVSFDWQKHLCFGKEKIRFTAYHYPTDSFILDAKNFIFKNIQLYKNGKEFAFRKRNDETQLKIYLHKPITNQDTLEISFNYTAQPDKNISKGSAAIKDDKGLYFINTDKKEPFKPTQLWTQGETESNSNWFATIDKPHEKMTFDINITVADSLTTLSNGIMTHQEKKADTRTDYWQVSKPMSAYLVMMAIGKFEKTTDEKYKGKEVSYYLENAYHRYAKRIFKHTPEMIEFFSEKVGYDYPWGKYAQVVVRDFVSGAMENTSATLHGAFVQKDNRELVDKQNDGIVAHELFHHWFGDLVTCASWSHLTLNEGFATFGEQLWFGHKYGETAELLKKYKSMQSYLRFSKRNDKAIIRFFYNDKEELFNPITYQKGARVLNLLRYTVGEKTFFTGIKNYLKSHEYGTAQIENLRFEMEKVSGRDLRSFFQQWFHSGGHPIIQVRKNIEKGELEIIQEQTKKVFEFPFQYRVENKIVTIEIKKRKTKIKLSPTQINTPLYLDPNCLFIGEIKNELYDDKSVTAYYRGALNLIEKMRILDALSPKKDQSIEEEQLLLLALNDKLAEVSYQAMKKIDWENKQNISKAKEDLKRIANFSTHSNQKSQAIYVLGGLTDPLLEKDFLGWSQATSYQVAAAGLYGLKKINPTKALEQSLPSADTAKSALFTEICNLYATNADSNNQYFSNQLMRRFGSERNYLISSYLTWASRYGSEKQNLFWSEIMDRAQQDDNKWTRYYAMKSLHRLAEDSKYISNTQRESLLNIMKNEKDGAVKRMLQINQILPTEKIEK